MGQFALPLALLGVGVIGLMLIGPKKSTTAAPDSMPKLNSAVRGTGIPVSFGTNKISSQVVWTKNFLATAQQASGKGGGSGGFGSAKGGDAGSGYNYTWDMMFNFGIADVPMMIRRGWIGGDTIDQTNIAALTSGLSSAFIDLFPPSSLTDTQTATLSYTEAFVGAGYPTGDPGLINWPYFQAQENVACAWPFTLYTGFQQLVLGQTPTVPQLFFEWVPLDAVGQFEPESDGYISTVAHASGSQESTNNGTLVEDSGGKLYSLEIADATHIYVTNIDGSTQTNIGSVYVADAASVGVTLGGAFEQTGIFPVGGRYFYLVGWVGVGGGSTVWCLCYLVNADGSVSFVDGGGVSDGFNSNLAMSDVLSAGVISTGEVAVLYSDFGSESAHMQLFPKPEIFKAHAGWVGVNNGRANFTELGNFALAPGSGRGTTRLGSVVGDYAYIYVGKSEMDFAAAHSSGTGFNAYYKSIQPTYPNGALIRIHMISDGFGTASYLFDGPVNDYGAPYPDVGLQLDGSAGTADDDYGPPIATNNNLVTVSRGYSNDILYSAGVRVYAGPDTQVVDMHGVFANSSNYTGSGISRPAVIILQDNQVYIKAFPGSATIFATFAAIPPTAVDVTPAYIIYRILTNEAFGFATDSLFGFTVSADRIDQVSYDAAVAECERQGCFISVTYSNATNVLSIINDLLSLYGGFLTENDGVISFGVIQDSDASVRTLDNSHFVVDAGKPPVTVTKAAIDDGYNKVVFHYLDRALDYNQNEVTVSEEVDMDINGPRIKTWDTTFTMPGSLAAQIATRALWANLYGKDGFDFKTGWKDADLRPGNVVTIVDSFDPSLVSGRRVRLIKRSATDTRGVFEWNAVQEYSNITNAAGFYTSIASIDEGWNSLVDAPQPPLFQTAYELPREFNAAGGELYFSYGMASRAMGAQLHLSNDGVSFHQAQDIQPFPISGVLVGDLPQRGHGHREDGIEFYVFPTVGFVVSSQDFVMDYALDDITQATRAAGGGVVIVGSEAISFQNLTLLGQNHYRAKWAYRGWGGSPISAHSSGSNFHAHAQGVFLNDITQDDIGTTLYYKIAPYNFAGKIVDLSSLAIGSYTIKGDFWLPRQQPHTKFWVDSAISWPSSTAFKGNAIGVTSGGCGVTLTWPLADNAEGYGAGGYGAGAFGHFTLADSVNWRVDVMSKNGTSVSSFTTTTPLFKYTLAQNSADFHAFGKDLIFKVTPYNVKGDGYSADVCSFSIQW